MKRQLRPRATAGIVVQPATVTDLSSYAVLGLEPRQFRELVERLEIRHARVGHRVVCRVDDVLEAIGRAARSEVNTREVNDEAEDDGPRDVADVLALVGKRRTKTNTTKEASQ